MCSTPFAQDTLLALQIHQWNNPAKATDMGWVGEVHLRARVENDELVDKQILCTRCGGPAKVASTLLECTQCGKPLAEFATEDEMERDLAEIWRGARPYLVHPPPKTK